MIIQKIKSNKLYLENDEVIDINPDIIHEFKLKSNMDISGIYTDIIKASIKNKAFYYIYLKSRTRYELLSKLKLKYFDKKELIEEVLDYLEENLYINDVDYAISYILSHKNSKTKNTMKLLQKGIKKQDIDEAYEDIPNDMEKEQLSEEVRKLKEKNYEDAKIILTLTRKGYRYNDIKENLKK
ncbi:regulatory protein RecX [Oceanivirga miroungae]|uniref:Regulatory protein RecX n=1 Tax=Oceanivirga miroungae TaxID=1130046 RepID=A0A6I8MCL0_9FUSO|nr:regulatory protein RecX [Oceanivirga miroungae]VWL85169.1 regulatory protein RecX [Oceanivirga miroungae]